MGVIGAWDVGIRHKGLCYPTAYLSRAWNEYHIDLDLARMGFKRLYKCPRTTSPENHFFVRRPCPSFDSIFCISSIDEQRTLDRRARYCSISSCTILRTPPTWRNSRWEPKRALALAVAGVQQQRTDATTVIAWCELLVSGSRETSRCILVYHEK